MKRSTIGWTDFSGGDLNVVTGCTPVSRGCQHCYARVLAERFGRDFAQVVVHSDKLARLARRAFPQDGNKRGPHRKPLAFLCNTGDLFHEAVPEQAIAQVLDVLAARRDVVWQLLTKRPERLVHMAYWMGEYWAGDSTFNEWSAYFGHWPGNIWVGVSVEDQATANERIPPLLEVPAAVRLVSVEPMLEEIDLGAWLSEPEPGEQIWLPGGGSYTTEAYEGRPALDWVIVGAESGKGRRPFRVEWAADVYAQCAAAGVPFFGKQDSAFTPGAPLYIDGREVHEWPTT